MNILTHRLIAAVLFFVSTVGLAFSQDREAGRDSVIYRQSASLDSTLAGKDIFSLLSGHYGESSKVSVHQSQRIIDAE